MGKNYVSKNDLKRLNNADLVEQRYRIIYNTLWYSGMRPGELLKTRPADIFKEKNEEKQKIYYFFDLATQKNKTKNELTPIRELEYIAIIDYINQNKIHQTGYIFGSPRGKKRFRKQMTVSWLGRKLKKHLELVGIEKDITPQSFRSGLVTYLHEEKGIPYAEIATITRHQNLDVMKKHYDKRIKYNAFNLIESM